MPSKKTIILIGLITLVLLAMGAIILTPSHTPPTAVPLAAAQKISTAPVAEPETGDDIRNQRAAQFTEAANQISQPTPSPTPEQAVATGYAWPDENLVPTIYAEPDPKDPTWTPEALDKLRLMREWFARAAEPLNKMDSTSPEYYADWKVLQGDFDDQFRAQFGDEAFVRYERQQEQANTAAQP